MSDAHLSVDRSGMDWSALRHLNIEDALWDGAEVVLDRARELAPKESGNLADSAFIDESRGGTNAVGFGFDSVYAAYQHENLEFKHPQGGQAKYLEAAMLEKSSDALDTVTRKLLGPS